LIGFIGIVLASPVVATLKLFLRYTVRKLFDLDPWEGLEEEETPRPQSPLVLWLSRIWETVYHRVKIVFHKKVI
jgi:hypothetical protein